MILKILPWIILFLELFSIQCYCSKIKNVLLLLADDGGFEMGAYLNKFCQTPNLDKLAKQSLIFHNAFTSVSSCSPSRAQILTGMPSHQNGMYGLHQSYHHFNVFDKIHSLPNILKRNGITTGLVGKKHVGPKKNFHFDYEQTEENHPINQVGRNITQIKLFVREFLENVTNDGQNTNPFFLMVAFHDPHRCGHITPQYGQFCERWGSGETGMGTIPDWKPIYYDWRNLNAPYYLPQTDAVKQEISAQYMTISRLDQGVGLVLNELKRAKVDDETLVIYTSDNGPPFPGGRTNLYDPGVREPMFIYSPENGSRRNSVTYSMSSLLDVFPTILDVFKNNESLAVPLTGKSLLPLLKDEPKPDPDEAIFGSQNFHEITMNYPMRMIRTKQYKLIHNLNYESYFPVDQDLYTSDTFQDILNATLAGKNLPWFKNLKSFYDRPEWELYDVRRDAEEIWNLAGKSKFKDIRKNLEKRLMDWQIKTNDPWRCSPHAVLEESGPWKKNPACLTLGHNSLKSKY
ncbi:N-sulphoglucosamine sulphohydrolase, partial [Condylostylus longicornis]|uniref:N-sulphoglucosamine sulphohydrolase n=1 Tax=Condylostylus longicornis TaxID=2530218 RepID=UPI00244DFBA2